MRLAFQPANPPHPDLSRRGSDRRGDLRLGVHRALDDARPPGRSGRWRMSGHPAGCSSRASTRPELTPAGAATRSPITPTKLNSAIGRFQRVDTFGRYYYAGLGLVVLLVGAAFLYASVRVGGHLSRQLSRPIEELIGWTGQHPPDGAAPARPAARGAPRVRGPAHGAPGDGHRARAGPRARDRGGAAPRLSGDGAAGGARDAEPAHADPPRRGAACPVRRRRRQREAIEVLVAESGRLEQLAREFTEFGRLPEGPAAQVDLAELLADLARTSVPPTMHVSLALDSGPPHAARATTTRCAARSATSSATRWRRARPGARSTSRPAPRTAWCGSRSATTAPACRPTSPGRLFDPYVTGKSGGTGLGLALAKQTIEMHQGTIAVQATPGGGATFVVRMRRPCDGDAPRSSWWTTRPTSAGCWPRCSARKGSRVAEAANGNAALLQLDEVDPDVVLLDLLMPPGPDGLETLASMRERGRGTPVIMMSGKAQLTDAVRAVKLGAFQFLEKPLAPESVLVTVRAALELNRTRARESRAARRAGRARSALVGESAAMAAGPGADGPGRRPPRRACSSPARAAPARSWSAAAVHGASRRSARAFVTVNCAAIPRDLVESEMFGHERGAFTGATERRLGRFELAHQGTLFLDEIGDLSAEAQAKLLRTLETGELQRSAPRARSGSTCASSRPPIAGWRTRWPTATSGRTCSSGSTSSRSASRRCASGWRTCPRSWPTWPSGCGRGRRREFTPQALDALAGYAWPGNVRELANLVERLSILCGPTVDAGAVRDVLRGGSPPPPAPTALGRPLSEALDDYERGLIARRADAGGGEHRRGRAGAADRPRQSVPPHAAAGPRPGVAAAALTTSTLELRMRLLAGGLLFLLALPPLLRAQDSVIVIDPDAARRATRRRAGRPAARRRVRAAGLLQRQRDHPGAGGRRASRPAASSPAGWRSSAARSGSPDGSGATSSWSTPRCTCCRAPTWRATCWSWAAGSSEAREPGTSGRERVLWDAAPVLRGPDGVLVLRERRRPLGELATAARQLPDRPRPDRRCCSPPAAPTTGSRGCRSSSARPSSSGPPGDRSRGWTCAASSALRARGPG